MSTTLRSYRLSLALVALFGVGCYEYLPMHRAQARHGERVQLTLTDSGALALATRIGPQVEAVEGSLLADSAGVYLVAVAVTRARGGVESDWRGERVAIPHALVSSIAERRFSRSRSTFVGALMTAGVVGITTALRGGGESSGGIPSPGRTPGQ